MSVHLLSRNELVTDDGCEAHFYRVCQEPTIPSAKVVHLVAERPEVTIGRNPSSNLYLSSKKTPAAISREHAKLVRDANNGWKIVDNNSTNGVFVNLTRVKEALLKDDDIVVFGGGFGVAIGGEQRIQYESEFIFLYKSKEGSHLPPTQEDPEQPLKRARTGPSVAEEEKRQEELKKKIAELEQRLDQSTKADSEKLQAERAEWRKELAEKEAQLQQEIKAREERLQAELRAVAEQAIKAQQELEMQKHLSAENQRLQSTLEDEKKKTQSTEKLKESLEQELKRTRQEMGSLVKRTEFQEEISCPICSEPFVRAMTVECSHTFCFECITACLERKKGECPVCRSKLTKEPMPCIAVDNVVDRYMKNESAEDQRILEERRQLAKLKEMVAQAKTRGMCFLFIGTAWTPQNRRVFTDGVKRYQGKARREYCALTSLDPKWIETAQLAALKIACGNLNITCDVESEPSFRKKLLDFINGV